MLALGHLGDGGGQFAQGLGCAPSGDDHVLSAGTLGQHLQNLVQVDPAAQQRVGELVQHVEPVGLRRHQFADVPPGGARDLGLGVQVATAPGPGEAQSVRDPADGPALAGLAVQGVQGLEGDPLAGVPTGRLDELEHPDRPALRPATQRGAERGR